MLKSQKMGEPEAVDLAELAKSRDWHDRRKVAWNPETTEEILLALSRDEVQWVREAVAGNSRSPEEVLVRLADDGEIGRNRVIPDAGCDGNRNREVRRRFVDGHSADYIDKDILIGQAHPNTA